MYSLTVSDHVMIAHSFQGAAFGPAQRLHGATYTVEAEFRAARLDGANLLVDIGLARAELRRALDGFDYRNLDELLAFTGQNTTTEFLAAYVHELLSSALLEGRMGAHGRSIASLKVTMRESPLAWAAFEGPVASR